MNGIIDDFVALMHKLRLLFDKIFIRAIIYTPKRWKRVVSHFIFFIPGVSHLKPQSVLDWFLDLLFYIIDCVYVPEIHDCILILIKPGVRLLNQRELFVARLMFNDSIDTNLVLLDERPFRFTSRFALAYVGFNTIYLTRSVSDDILVHELVHVWQFQKYGSVYIYRALKAQFSKNTYDYGGAEKILEACENSWELSDFNFEQQAEIIQDFYKIKYSHAIIAKHEYINSYNYFYQQLG